MFGNDIDFDVIDGNVDVFKGEMDKENIRVVDFRLKFGRKSM